MRKHSRQLSSGKKHAKAYWRTKMEAIRINGLPRDKKPFSQFEDADDGLYKVAAELRRLLENWD